MGGACSMHGDEKCVQNLGLESLKGSDHLDDLGIDETILLKLIVTCISCTL
jgi:hypothetical protein